MLSNLILAVFLSAHCVAAQLCAAKCEQETPHRIAILVPFIERQVPMLVACIRRWFDRPPFCVEQAHVRQSIDVILYYHRSPAHLTEASRAAIDAVLDEMPTTERFFRRESFSFMFANLTDEEDVYPIGANLMFYNLFLVPATFAELSSRFKFFALLEPDVRPLRACWANKVYNETLGSFFWQKGSQFRGRYLPAHFRTHINGNAIYGLGAEAEPFVEILAQVKATWSLRMGYDNNIMQWMIMERNFQAWYDWIHMFVYSNFILNMHWTEYQFHEFERRHLNTFLIHNGNATDLPAAENNAFTELPE